MALLARVIENIAAESDGMRRGVTNRRATKKKNSVEIGILFCFTFQWVFRQLRTRSSPQTISIPKNSTESPVHRDIRGRSLLKMINRFTRRPHSDRSFHYETLFFFLEINWRLFELRKLTWLTQSLFHYRSHPTQMWVYYRVSRKTPIEFIKPVIVAVKQ